MSEDAYARLVTTTAGRAQVHEKFRQQRVATLNLAMKQKRSDGEETRDAITAKIMMEKINESTLKSDIARLIRLQAGLRQPSK